MKKILFFDDFCAWRSENTKRIFREPDWNFDSAFCDPNSPRGIVGTSATAAPQGGFYLYYSTVASSDKFADEYMLLCVAHSDDGVHFENYAVKDPVDPAQPHILGRMSDPIGQWVVRQENGMYLAPCARIGIDKNGEKYGLPPILVSSEDALHWKKVNDSPIVPEYADCFISVLYNPLSRCYQATTRRRWGERRIYLTESKDLAAWTEPQTILHTSPIDPPSTHMYGMPQFYLKDSGLFIGMLRKLQMPYADISGGQAKTEYVYSYDGKHWIRTFADVMSLKPRGKLGAGRNYVFSMMEENNTLRFFANVCIADHGGPLEYVSPDGGYSCAVVTGSLKRDRFVCLDSGVGTGYIRTVPLIPKSDMTLNMVSPFGRAAARVLKYGKTVEGFDFEDCCPLIGDSLNMPVHWKGGSIIEVSKGEAIQIEIRFEQSELYAVNLNFAFRANGGTVYENL